MLCWFLLYNDVKQLYIHMYPFPLGPPSHPPSYPSGSSQSTVLSLCTMQKVSTGCLCYVWQCTHVSPNSSHPPQPRPHISSLYLCLYSCRTNRFICTTFLDSTYINCYSLKKKKTHSIPQAQIKFMSCPTSPWQASYTKNRHSSEPEGCVAAEPLFCLGPWASLHFTLLFCQRCLMCWCTAVCCIPLQSFGLLYGQGAISSSVPDFCSLNILLFFFPPPWSN